jgi:hypothetical protein
VLQFRLTEEPNLAILAYNPHLLGARLPVQLSVRLHLFLGIRGAHDFDADFGREDWRISRFSHLVLSVLARPDDVGLLDASRCGNRILLKGLAARKVLVEARHEGLLLVRVVRLVRTQDDLPPGVGFDFVRQVAKGGICDNLVPALLLVRKGRAHGSGTLVQVSVHTTG